MLYKFNTVKATTISPEERRQRIAQLFAIFEKNTADSSVTLAGESESAAEANQSEDRQRVNSTTAAVKHQTESNQ